MKSKREQIISLLKAAVMDDGEVMIEMHLFVKRTLPSLHPISTPHYEATDGCVFISRRYRFSYIDKNDLHRCFSRYPFESLARGVFFDVREAKVYLKAFARHFIRLNPSHVNENEERDCEEILLKSTLDMMSDKASSLLNDGKIIDACEWMVQLEAILTSSSTKAPHCLKQIGSISTSIAGYFVCVKDAVKSLRNSSLIIADGIQQVYGSSNVTEDHISEEQQKDLDKYNFLYRRLSPCTIELKVLIINMLRECTPICSELSHVSSGLINQLYMLFNPDNKTEPLLDPNPFNINKTKGLAGVVPLIYDLDRHLHQIVCSLELLETSIGMVVITEIMNRDALGYIQPENLYGNVCEEKPRHFSQVPKTFTDFLGYIDARCQAPWHKIDKTILPKPLKNASAQLLNSTPEYWLPFPIQSWNRYFTYGGVPKTKYNTGK
jgi:hypothetical protein